MTPRAVPSFSVHAPMLFAAIQFNGPQVRGYMEILAESAGNLLTFVDRWTIDRAKRPSLDRNIRRAFASKQCGHMKRMIGKASRAYSQDLRERVLNAVHRGMPAYSVAPIFQVSVSYVYNVLRTWRQTGSCGTPRQAGRKPKLAAYDDVLCNRLRDYPASSVADLLVWLKIEHNIQISKAALKRRARVLGLRLKFPRRGRPKRKHQ